jgi:hypothetical protein
VSKSRKNNALRHGAHASEVLLWSEKYEDYEKLRADLELEHAPDGATERYLVRTLLDLLWRRGRLQVYEQIELQTRLEDIRATNERSYNFAYLKLFANDFNEAKSAAEVEGVLTKIHPTCRPIIESNYPLAADEEPTKWGARIATAMSYWRIAERYEAADEFIQAIDLEKFDAHLARCERLDAAIERTMKRLLQLKAHKQMHRGLEPKLIITTAAAAE